MKVFPVSPEQQELMEKFQEDMLEVDPDKGASAYLVSSLNPARFHYEHANFLFSVWLKGLQRNK